MVEADKKPSADVATAAEDDVADVAKIVRFGVYGYQIVSGLYIGLTCNL